MVNEMGWLEQEEGIEDTKERKMLCSGCLGDKATHWHSGCWILKCCVDSKGHQNCSECGEFPCYKLKEWSKQNVGYAKAFELLVKLHGKF